MGKIFLIILSILLVICVLAYTWMNRDSDRVVLTLGSALLLGALGFITKESISNKTEISADEYPVVVFYGLPYYRPLNIKFPYWHSLGMCIQEVRESDIKYSESGSIDIKFGSEIYFDAIQYIMVKKMFETFGQGWKIKVRRISGPSSTSVSTQSLPGGKDGTKIRFADVMANLPNNYFQRLGMASKEIGPFGGEAVFPPETTYTIQVQDGIPSVVVLFKNKFVEVSVRIENSGSSMGIGDYEKLLGGNVSNQNRTANSTFFVSTKITQTVWFNGHPDMPAYRAWADELVAALKAEFDFNFQRDAHVRDFQLYGSIARAHQ